MLTPIQKQKIKEHAYKGISSVSGKYSYRKRFTVPFGDIVRHYANQKHFK